MKLWAVTIERTIMVLAEDETKAEQAAIESEREESANEADFISARECKYVGDVPKLWRDCIPYGGPDGPLRDLNCLQVLEHHSASAKPT